MEIIVPVRLFSPPSSRTFTTDQAGQPLPTPRTSWSSTAILGQDACKLYSDDDPTAGLNGSRKRLQDGEMVKVDAVLRLYPRKSGIGVQLERYQEPAKSTLTT